MGFTAQPRAALLVHASIKFPFYMKRFFLFGFLVASIAAGAQHQVRTAYFGETVTHYGFKIAYDRPLNTKAITKRNGSSVQRQWLAGGGVAFFRHPHQQKGLIVAPEVMWRRTGKRGGLIDVAFSPAFFRYFYEGTTYEFREGVFRQVALAGGNAFLPTISLGGGRDLSVRQNKPWMWYYRVNLMRQIPYNASALTRFSLEAGIIYKM
jgi:hypothetical protein